MRWGGHTPKLVDDDIETNSDLPSHIIGFKKGANGAATTLSAPTLNDNTGTSILYDDKVITESVSRFALVVGDAYGYNSYAHINKDNGVLLLPSVVAQKTLHLNWVNTDRATPTLTPVVGDPIIEPSGSVLGSDGDGSMTFSLELGDKTLAVPYSFALTAETNGNPIKALSVVPSALYASGILTFPSGTDKDSDSVTISTGFSGATSDGKGSKVTLHVRNADASDGSVYDFEIGGIDLPSDPDDSSGLKKVLSQDFGLTDADKATPVFGTLPTITENAVIPDFTITLSRDTNAANVQVDVQASYTDSEGTTTKGNSRRAIFPKGQDATTTAKTISGLTLPTAVNGDLVNLAPRTIKIIATIRAGSGDDAEVDRSAVESSAIALVDDEADDNKFTLTYAGGTTALAEGATSTLTLTLDKAADEQITFALAGVGGTKNVPLSLTANDDITLALKANDPATGETFTASGLGGTFTMPKGVRVAVLDVTAKDDTLIEGDESLTWTLSDGGNTKAYIKKSDGADTATFEIDDAEDATPLALSIDASSWSDYNKLYEDGSANIVFTLTTPDSNTLQRPISYVVNTFRIRSTADVKHAKEPIFRGDGWTAGATAGTGTITFPAKVNNPTRPLLLFVPDIDDIVRDDLEVFFYLSTQASDPLSAATTFTAPLKKGDSTDDTTPARIPIKDNDIKSISFGTVPQLKEGVAATIPLFRTGDALSDTSDLRYRVVFRPKVGADVALANGTLDRTQEGWRIAITVPGDETLNAGQVGKLIVTINSIDRNLEGWANGAVVLESSERTVTNTEGAIAFWDKARSNGRQKFTGTEGETFTPQARLALIPASATPTTQAPDYSKAPILSEDLKVTLSASASVTTSKALLTFKAGANPTRLSDTSSGSADFSFDDNIVRSTNTGTTLTITALQKASDSTTTFSDGNPTHRRRVQPCR